MPVGANDGFLSLLKDTCTIQAKTVGVTDGLGQQVFAWTNETEDEPCRLEVTSDTEIINEQAVVVQGYNLMLQSGVTISEDHRVIISGLTYSVNAVRGADDADSAHHIEAVLDLIKG